MRDFVRKCPGNNLLLLDQTNILNVFVNAITSEYFENPGNTIHSVSALKKLPTKFQIITHSKVNYFKKPSRHATIAFATYILCTSRP